MRQPRPRSAAWGAALALALSACAAAGGGGERGGPPDPGDAAPTTTEDGHDADRHADATSDPDTHEHPAGEDPDEEGPAVEAESAAREGTTATERTLATLRDLDPARLAAAHDHGDEGHGEHDEHAASPHPNGIDPDRIVIPAIGVDADVIDLGLQPDGSMEVPSDFAQTGWFDRGPRPGRVGPAVIAGHVDDRSGPAVFHRLVELSPGDLIEVHGEDGELVTFEVRETERHPKDDFPTEQVYSGTPGPELRLITCGGEFDQGARSYRDNVIVYAERLDT